MKPDAFRAWYRKHAKTTEGRKEGPPEDLCRVLKEIAPDFKEPFVASPYKNAAGRWASLATAATGALLTYDACTTISLDRPFEHPSWMPPHVQDPHWRWPILENLAGTLSGHDRRFCDVLRRAHGETLDARFGKAAIEEFDEILMDELHDLIVRVTKAFRPYFDLTDHVGGHVVWGNVYEPIRQWYLFQAAGDRPAADVMRRVIEESKHGLIIGGDVSGEFYGPHPVLVLVP